MLQDLTGQVAWIDGGKEESRLRFGAAENRRPINWRELMGVTRIFELYGDQLRGRCILVETDNMAAKGAASSLSSKRLQPKCCTSTSVDAC